MVRFIYGGSLQGEMGERLPYSGKNSIQDATVAVHFPAEFIAEIMERPYHGTAIALKDEFSQFNAIHRQTGEVKINIDAGQEFHPHVPQNPDFSRV